MPEAPWRDDARNDGGGGRGPTACPVCQRPFRPAGRQRVCSAACRQKRWRQHHPAPLPLLPPRRPRAETVYACPACDTRYLGTQRCEDCGVFCRRIGPGGPCPHCDEPVALLDLLPTERS